MLLVGYVCMYIWTLIQGAPNYNSKWKWKLIEIPYPMIHKYTWACHADDAR